jgi:peptidoglycan/LPS O-acetylase OafA/YrhL
MSGPEASAVSGGSTRERLHTLDGLRGIAALLVMFSHLDLPVMLAPGGYLAVDFFFVLSGVVIAENYGPRLREGLPLGRFVAVRIVRLYPMFAVGLAFGAARALAQVTLHQPSALPLSEIALAGALGLFMLPSPSSIPPLYPLLSPGWSLFFELVANAAYAAGRATRRLPLLVGICALAAGGLLWTVRSGAGLWMGGSWSELPIGLARVAFSFTLGVALYEGVLRHGRARATALAWVPVVLTAAIMVVWISPMQRGAFDLAAVVIALPLLVWLGARWNPPARWQPLFAWLGEISYPLYTTHYSLIFVATFVARRWSLSPWLWAPALTIALLALATVLARHVDEPARRWLTRHLLRPSPRRPA